MDTTQITTTPLILRYLEYKTAPLMGRNLKEAVTEDIMASQQTVKTAIC